MAPNSLITKLVAESHIEDLRREAARSTFRRLAKDASRRALGNVDVPITIRPARSADASALARLAALASARVPSVPVLIAEADGELRAALSLCDGAAITDPAHPTAWMLQLLHARAAQLRGTRPLRRRHLLPTPAR